MEWKFAGTVYEWSAEWFQAWAGVFQAIGSIVAIGAGFALAARQATDIERRSQLDRSQRHSDVIEAASALGQAAYDRLSRMNQTAQNAQASLTRTKSWRERYGVAIQALKAFDVSQLRDADLIVAFTAMSGQATLVLANIDEAILLSAESHESKLAAWQQLRARMRRRKRWVKRYLNEYNERARSAFGASLEDIP